MDAEETTQPWPSRPRVGPAVIVVALAVLVAGGGAALSLIGTGDAPVHAAQLGRLPGVTLAAESARPLLARVASGGEPPKDIASAVVVPAGTVYVGRQAPAGLQLYSASVSVSVDAPPAQVLAFYRAELRHDGWSDIVTDATASGDGEEVLARHGSADGYYWGLGAIVRAVTPSISPALAGGEQEAPTSSLTLSLYEIDDSD
jgi:hypothetical protein